jgi:hypothetical protein
MDPSTHNLWTLLICVEHYPLLQAFPIHSASNHSLTVLLIFWVSEQNLAMSFIPWASSCNLVIYTTLTCTHRSHHSKHNSNPNTRRCKILPLQSNLLGDVSSLGLGCPVIVMRIGGHDSKFLHKKLHVLKHACQPMAPWSSTFNDLLLVGTLMPLNMQIRFNDSFPNITSLFFLGFC